MKSALSIAIGILPLAVILTGVFPTKSGATVLHSDGSAASVRSLHKSAQNGDTITLPAGSFNWDRQILITKAITLQGAGPGATNVTSSYTGGQAVAITCVPGQTTIIRDFSVGNTSAANCFFYVTGSGIRQYRFTNLSFSGSGVWSIWISSPGDPTKGEGAYGVIDSCTWSGGRSGLFVRDNPNANPNSWNRPMTFGTEEAVYVEDCTFTAVSQFPNANIGMDGDNGCRIVFRHNTLQDYCVGTHGADSSGPINSALQHEVMHNTFTVTDQVGQAFCVQFRGGTGVVFDNTMQRQGSGEYNSLLALEYYRASVGGGGVCQQDRFYPQDYVGTQQPGSGYRVPGQDPHYSKAPCGSVPVYVWNNHVNAPLRFGEVVTGPDAAAALFMQQRRDYFVDTSKPGYAEFTYPHPLTTSGPSPATTTNSQQPLKKEEQKAKKGKWNRGKRNSAGEMTEPQADNRNPNQSTGISDPWSLWSFNGSTNGMTGKRMDCNSDQIIKCGY